MHILHLTNKPVFPAIDGGCKAMQRMLECFKENAYSVKHLCISTEKHPFNTAAYPDHSIDPETVFISTKMDPLKAAINLLKGRSYHLARFESSELKSKLIQILQKEQFDLIFLESIYSTTALEVIRNYSMAKIVIRTHNVEFKLWERIAFGTKNPLKKWYISKLAAQLKREELLTLNKVDAIATLSVDDSELFRSNGINVKMELIPISLPNVPLKSTYSNPSFYHLGSMNWKPNQEAVLDILENIFPAILKEIPDAHLKLAGSFMIDFLTNKTLKNVEVTGFADNADDFFRQEGIFLCPDHSGSGIRIKILEAMNVGSPIITTRIGAEGLNENNALIIASNEQDFIQSAIDLYRDEAKRKDLGTKSHQYIRANYSIQAVANKLNDFLRSI
jgi:glycosyltransferase involved in cell wall biosynthesis